MLTTRSIQLSKLDLLRWPVLFVAGWVLTMVAIPVVRWTWGDNAKLPFVMAGVLLQAMAVLVILAEVWGWRRTGQTAVLIALLTLVVEMLGANTGFLFGHYDYTSRLQPQVWGVPLLIPAAWLMMLPPSWATMSFLLRGGRSETAVQRWWRQVGFIVGSALALTAWDLLLDPQMVSWRFWVWQQPGGYFGIPWQNFWGWFVTAAILTWLLRPARLPVRPLLVVYTITWFLETVGLAVLWGMPGPALVGGLAMLLFVYLGWFIGTTPRES